LHHPYPALAFEPYWVQQLNLSVAANDDIRTSIRQTAEHLDPRVAEVFDLVGGQRTIREIGVEVVAAAA
jgi:hypothetical protein